MPANVTVCKVWMKLLTNGSDFWGSQCETAPVAGSPRTRGCRTGRAGAPGAESGARSCRVGADCRQDTGGQTSAFPCCAFAAIGLARDAKRPCERARMGVGPTSNSDLMLSKMMRYDPTDLDDLAFVVARSGLVRDDVARTIDQARLPDSEEVHEQFGQCLSWLVRQGLCSKPDRRKSDRQGSTRWNNQE